MARPRRAVPRADPGTGAARAPWRGAPGDRGVLGRAPGRIVLNLLGFDTSTAATSAAVLRADGEVFESPARPGALSAPPAHARELLGAIERVMSEAAVGWEEIGAVVVGRGPGTFTGLRIGLATARGIARARGLGVRAVSSLAALAAGSRADLRLALIDARRGELFAALYEGGEHGVQRELLAPFVAPVAGVIARAGEIGRGRGRRTLAIGDGSLGSRQALEAAGIEVAPEHSPRHVVRASSVCLLGAVAPETPISAVLPDYIRAPDARPPR